MNSNQLPVKATNDVNIYLSGARNMAEAIRDSQKDPFNSAFQVPQQSSIAMRMKQNKDALYQQQSTALSESPLQFQTQVESSRQQMINNMSNRVVGNGLQSTASAQKSREIN